MLNKLTIAQKFILISAFLLMGINWSDSQNQPVSAANYCNNSYSFTGPTGFVLFVKFIDLCLT